MVDLQIYKPLKLNKSKFKKRDLNLIDFYVLHHSAGRGDVYKIQAEHKARGFSDIGYHFYITRKGNCYEGRPIEYVGAHCKGNNLNTIGICLEGDFRKESPTGEQLIVCCALIEYLDDRLECCCEIVNHRDFCATLCPVVDLANIIREMLDGGDYDAED
ncbi:MAG: peptidoglycan recognition protein family protein [Acetobacter sp.]|nr:peptidoglycan recognition protein family protein [Acetobacter sp.]